MKSSKGRKEKTTYVTAEKEGRILPVVSCAVLLTAAACLFVMMTGVRYVLTFVIGLPAVYLLIEAVKSKGRTPAYIVTGICAAVLIAAVIVMRGEITCGVKLILNSLYEASENTQAYIYKKYAVDQDPGAYMYCMRAAVLTGGMIIGLAAASVPERMQKWFCLAVCSACMTGFTYFGLLPAMVPAAAMLAGLIMVFGNGHFRSLMPLILCALLVFAAVCAVSPGESKAVSKADEQMRDRLATGTVSLVGKNVADSEHGTSKTEKKKEQREDQNGGELFKRNRKVWIVLGLILLTLLILFVPAVIHDRLEKRRKKNRGDIGSADAGAAIRAMFPYAVKWLAACGLEERNVPFADYNDDVGRITSGEYQKRYMEMLDLWKLAAYSDKTMTQSERDSMKNFMNETISMVTERQTFADKMKMRFVYAL